MKQITKVEKGLTLIEVLIAMAFVSLLYAFVVQVFFNGFRNITLGDIEDEGARLTRNEMVRLSSIENPLYIGLLSKEDGETWINKLKLKQILPYDLVDQGVVTIKTRETLKEETAENCPEIAKESVKATYKRTVDWQIEDIEPILVHLWVTVTWSDPKKEFKDGSYVLETMLAQ